MPLNRCRVTIPPMLSIAHGVTGAFIATKLPHPGLYVPLIFASHYLEDWIPHWDVGTGLSTGRRKKSTALILEAFELVVTVGLVYLFWQHGQAAINWPAWAGLAVSLMPDLLESPRNFLNWEPALLKPLNDLHQFFHHSTSSIALGLGPQVVVLAAVFLLK